MAGASHLSPGGESGSREHMPGQAKHYIKQQVSEATWVENRVCSSAAKVLIGSNRPYKIHMSLMMLKA